MPKTTKVIGLRKVTEESPSKKKVLSLRRSERETPPSPGPCNRRPAGRMDRAHSEEKYARICSGSSTSDLVRMGMNASE